MNSPFAVFRKHQKVLMVALTGLAMFAFVVLDSLTQNMSAFPPIFGALLGVGLAWWIIDSFFSSESHEHATHQKSTGEKYAWVVMLVGGVGGWFLGSSFLASLNAGSTVVETSFGSVSEQELMEVIDRRKGANQFLMEAFRAANSGGEIPSQYAQLALGRYLFGGNGDSNSSALMHLLMIREAEAINLTVTDEQVSSFIHTATFEKLHSSDYRKIISTMGLSHAELFNLLREQMIAKQMRRMLFPRHLATPEDYWDAYQKINVKQELAVVPLAVESFLAETGKPAEEELKTLFEEYKEFFPNQKEAGSPGFRQPDRIRLGYFEVDYDTVEKSLPAVTIAEVEKYYEENKEQFRNPVAPEFPPSDKPEMTPEKGETPESTEPKKPDEEEKKPASTPDKTKTPATEKPTEPTKKEPGTPEVKPEPPAKPPVSEKPAATKKTPAPVKETSEGESQSSIPSTPLGAAFASIQDEKPEPKEAQPASPATKAPVEKQKPAGKSESEKPAEPVSSEKPPATDSKPKEGKPDDKSKSEGKPEAEGTKKPETFKPTEPLPEFKPLDEVLREAIRAQILDSRVREKMQESASASRGHMFSLFSDYAVAQDDQAKKVVAQEIQKEAKKYAAENNLRYVETPYYSYDELEESEDHPIGKSTLPAEGNNVFNRGNLQTVIQQHFGLRDIESIERQRYHAFDAEDPTTLNRFVHWQIDFKRAHLPQWDEKGVKEQVVKSWKTLQARKLATKRAEEIADLLKKTDKTWGEALTGQLETGKEGSSSLVVSYTGPFSWMSQSSAPNPNSFQPNPAVITQIPIIFGGVDDRFMKNVFQDLNNGDIGTTWSGDRRYIFIARVDKRTEVATTRTDFLAQKESIFADDSPYSTILRQDSGTIARSWNEEIFKRYEVKWADEQ